MTQEEIIEMAKQVCDIAIDNRGRHTFVCDEYGLEAFAKLVAQHERELLTDAAMKAAEKVVDVAMALEREACIDIVAMFGGSIEIEAAIRARAKA
jgi:hypothetical protein